jgi:hypothetical protein
MQTVWNRINTALLVLVLLLLAGALAKGVWSGPMDPTGTPGPTLPQVEPRIPVSQPPPGGFPIVISQPGSYFLTQGILGEPGKDGIEISTDAVTLDLNGFTVAGVPGSLKGVHVTCSATCYLIQIRGGNVVSWGGDGIDMGLANTGQITGVQVSGNSGNGVAQGVSDMISDCIVGGNGGDGVDAGSYPVDVRNSSIAYNVGNGVVAGPSTVEGNSIGYNQGHGISVLGPSTVEGNSIGYNVGNGVVAGSSTVEGNTVASNGGHGISVSGGIIARNTSTNNGQDGILVTLGSCLMTDNNADGNQATGFEVLGPYCTIARNTAGDNGAPDYLNYAIAPGSDVGPIGWAATSASAWANISGYSY